MERLRERQRSRRRYRSLCAPVAMFKLTLRQRAILAHLRLCGRMGLPPTVRELGRAVGISSTYVVTYNLRRLEEKGLVIRGFAEARSARLSARGRRLAA